jgi:hypothetical protein
LTELIQSRNEFSAGDFHCLQRSFDVHERRDCGLESEARKMSQLVHEGLQASTVRRGRQLDEHGLFDLVVIAAFFLTVAAQDIELSPQVILWQTPKQIAGISVTRDQP